MRPATKVFHEALIRALRGMLTAWEKWLELQ
jgi:hypothetical protein